MLDELRLAIAQAFNETKDAQLREDLTIASRVIEAHAERIEQEATAEPEATPGMSTEEALKAAGIAPPAAHLSNNPTADPPATDGTGEEVGQIPPGPREQPGVRVNLEGDKATVTPKGGTPQIVATTVEQALEAYLARRPYPTADDVFAAAAKVQILEGDYEQIRAELLEYKRRYGELRK